MNITDQTHSKIPEAGDAMSFEQVKPDIANGYAGSLSDSDALELSVIARIPDLDAPSSPRKHKHSSRSRTTKSASPSGRLLSAGLSLKLLMSLGLLLLLGAIAPYVVIKVTGNMQSKTDNAIKQAWQPPPLAPTADLAPAWKPPIAQPQSTSTPKINASDAGNLVRWDNNVAQPNVTPTPAASAQSSPWPRDVDEKADFSPWPNPAHPILAETDPRQNESFTADRRNGPLSGGAVRTPSVLPLKDPGAARPSSENEAGTAQFEGMINTPSDRNIYDRSRPSIH